MLQNADFHKVHDNSASGVVALDEKGIIVYANPKAIQDFFLDDVYLGQPFDQFFKSLAGTAPSLINHYLNDEEFLFSAGNGVEKNVLISSSVHTDANNETQVYLFIHNITTLKKKERLLAYLNI